MKTCLPLLLMGGLASTALAADTPLQTAHEANWRALHQGCDIVDGVDYCAFHSNGWKFYAYRDGQSPAALLDALDQLPVNLPLRLYGRLSDVGDISAAITLTAVALDDGGDPYAAQRRALQGLWLSTDDTHQSLEVMGSELRWLDQGQFAELEFLQLGPDCAEAGPVAAGPYLVLTEPQDHTQPRCFAILELNEKRLQLTYLGRGNTLSFRRSR